MRMLTQHVNDNHYRIVSVGLRELHNKIHGDGLPALGGNLRGVEFTDQELPERLPPAAEVTCGDVPADMAGHLRPPVIPRHQLQRLEPTGMTGDPGVVVLLEDAPAEILVPGNNDFTSEVQEPTLGVPLGASRGPGARDFE